MQTSDTNLQKVITSSSGDTILNSREVLTKFAKLSKLSFVSPELGYDASVTLAAFISLITI